MKKVIILLLCMMLMMYGTIHAESSQLITLPIGENSVL